MRAKVSPPNQLQTCLANRLPLPHFLSVYVSGTVLSGDGFGSPCGYCRWKLHAGPAWTLLRGATEGQSHQVNADPCTGSTPGRLVFAATMDAALACNSLVGWPQLLLSVWTVDAHGRHALAGYGVARLPAGGGAHALEVACWRPRGSFVQEAAAAFLGAPPVLADPADALNARNRHRLATASTGTVLVEINMLLRGFEELGVETPGPAGPVSSGAAAAPPSPL